MSSVYESIMVEALTRLTDSVPFVPGSYGVRRSHRTAILREQAPGAHLIDGEDRPQQGKPCGARQGEFTVSIFVRDDDAGAGDEYKVELYRRMAEPWAPGIVVRPGRIFVDTELADEDAARIDCQFFVQYATGGEWEL